MKIRSEKTKKAFIKYLEEHPTERFWQSIKNFSKYRAIWGEIKGGEEDTFYKEEL